MDFILLASFLLFVQGMRNFKNWMLGLYENLHTLIAVNTRIRFHCKMSWFTIEYFATVGIKIARLLRFIVHASFHLQSKSHGMGLHLFETTLMNQTWIHIVVYTLLKVHCSRMLLIAPCCSYCSYRRDTPSDGMQLSSPTPTNASAINTSSYEVMMTCMKWVLRVFQWAPFTNFAIYLTVMRTRTCRR